MLTSAGPFHTVKGHGGRRSVRGAAEDNRVRSQRDSASAVRQEKSISKARLEPRTPKGVGDRDRRCRFSHNGVHPPSSACQLNTATQPF